jgi:hypothetical protein
LWQHRPVLNFCCGEASSTERLAKKMIDFVELEKIDQSVDVQTLKLANIRWNAN